MFENRVLGKVFGPKMDKVAREWRRLHIEEICVLYSLPNIIQTIKSRRMRWVAHVARERQIQRSAHNFKIINARETKMIKIFKNLKQK